MPEDSTNAPPQEEPGRPYTPFIFPSPEALRKYNNLGSGGQKIFDLWINNMTQQMEEEKKDNAFKRSRSYLGLGAAFIIGISGLGVSLWLGLAGREVPSTAGIVVDIASLTGVFITGTVYQVRSRQIAIRDYFEQIRGAKK